MPGVELVIGLLVAVVVLAGLAIRVDVPYPIVLVLGGVALGFVPIVPTVRLRPEVVFLVFLPPLLYSAAFRASTPQLRAAARPVAVLAVALVLTTVLAVAAVARLAIGVPWPAAFALGALLGPTDPVSATAVIRRLGAPERIVTLLEGEALVNDGTGLVAYKIAVGAVAASFSPVHAVVEFAAISAGGALVGVLTGWLSARVRRWVDDARIEITVSLLTPFAAYIGADKLGCSGVLAAVAAGLYVGWRSEAILSAPTRLEYHAFWGMLSFLLESLLFLLVGLQFHSAVDRLGPVAPGRVIAGAALVTGTILATRLAWMLTIKPTGAPPQLGERLVIAWSGMRGALSLAAGLALPLRFPERNALIVVTLLVILLTLVPPGLTLPALIRRLGLRDADGERRRDLRARVRLVHAALSRLDRLAETGELPEELIERLRRPYEARLRRLDAQLDQDGRPSGPIADGYPRLHRELIDAQRRTLDRLLRAGDVSASGVREIEHDLDLEEARIGE